MSDDEVDALLQGVEDSQGQVNYEGWSPFRICRQTLGVGTRMLNT